MWVINIISGLGLFLIGFFIYKFKMTYLIAGYNTSSKKVKEEYDTDKLVKYVGMLLMLSASILIIGGILSLIFSSFEQIIFIGSNILFTILLIFAVIYIIISGCVKK